MTFKPFFAIITLFFLIINQSLPSFGEVNHFESCKLNKEYVNAAIKLYEQETEEKATINKLVSSKYLKALPYCRNIIEYTIIDSKVYCKFHDLDFLDKDHKKTVKKKILSDKKNEIDLEYINKLKKIRKERKKNKPSLPTDRIIDFDFDPNKLDFSKTPKYPRKKSNIFRDIKSGSGSGLRNQSDLTIKKAEEMIEKHTKVNVGPEGRLDLNKAKDNLKKAQEAFKSNNYLLAKELAEISMKLAHDSENNHKDSVNRIYNKLNNRKNTTLQKIKILLISIEPESLSDKKRKNYKAAFNLFKTAIKLENNNDYKKANEEARLAINLLKLCLLKD